MAGLTSEQLQVPTDHLVEIHLPFLLLTDAQRQMQATEHGVLCNFDLGSPNVPLAVEALARYIGDVLDQPFNSVIWKRGGSTHTSFSESYDPRATTNNYAGKIALLSLMDRPLLSYGGDGVAEVTRQMHPGLVVSLSAAQPHCINYPRSAKYRHSMLLGYDVTKFAN